MMFLHETLVEVLRRRRCRSQTLETSKEELDKLRDNTSSGLDVALWKDGGDKFKRKFSSKRTWLQLRVDQPTHSTLKIIIQQLVSIERPTCHWRQDA